MEKDGFTVAGMPVKASWDELWRVMPGAWRSFLARCEEIPHRTGDECMDISQEENGDTYIQFICARVSRTGSLPKDMEYLEIPRQRYAHMRHIGPLPGIAESFGEIYNWAHRQNLSVDHFRLDLGYRLDGAGGPHDLYVRVLD